MEKISVIVPVYNVKSYLYKCIDSILNQTYSNIEIILIDDGSIDNCGEICDEYADKDDRIKVIHKKNEGVSKAREDGVKIAQGKYIAFVDGDDWVEDDYITTLYTKVKEYEADWISCNFNEVNGDKYKNAKLIEKEEIVTNVYNLYKDYFDSKFYAYVIWGKLFRTSLLRDYKFQRIKIGEDTCCMIDVFLKTKKAVLIEYKGYNYYMRENSATNHIRNKDIYDRLLSINYINSVINNNFPELATRMQEKKAKALFELYNQMFVSGEKEEKTLYLKKICKEIKKIKLWKLNINKKQKRNLFLIKYFENIFRFILQMRFPQYKK